MSTDMKYSNKIIHLAIIGLLLQGGSLMSLQSAAAADTTTDARQVTPLSEDQLAALMDDARQAMREQQYNRAIKYYNRLVEMPDNAYRRDAIELLGLAYERNGELKKAKETYEYYLQLYPRSDGAERVRQRLAGLTTARWQAPPELRKTKPEQETQPWRIYGSFYQYLYRDVSKLEGQRSVVNSNDLTTGLDITARGGAGAYNVNSRIAGSYFHDFENIYGNDQEVSYLYVDVSQNNNTWSGRLGRQRAYGGGVLGRFDGLNLGMQLARDYRLNMVVGAPVENTRNLSIDPKRRFYGINMDIGPWAEYWQANAYFIQQQDNNTLDRQAIGAELRYNQPKRSLYTLLDYDIYFNELNIFTSQASYTNKQGATYTLLLDHRNAPPITTNNALIGTSLTTLEALQQSYSDTEIHNLALDRTAKNTLVSLGLSQPLNGTYRLDADINSNKLSSTPASGGVAATDGTGMEYYLSGRLTAQSLFRHGDVNVVGMRLTQLDNGSSTSLMFNGLYPTSLGLRVNPRAQLTFQNYTDSGDKETTLSTGLRLEYVWKQIYTLEFDSGYDWSDRHVWFGSQKYQNYYLYLGYRIDF